MCDGALVARWAVVPRTPLHEAGEGSALCASGARKFDGQPHDVWSCPFNLDVAVNIGTRQRVEIGGKQLHRGARMGHAERH